MDSKPRYANGGQIPPEKAAMMKDNKSPLVKMTTNHKISPMVTPNSKTGPGFKIKDRNAMDAESKIKALQAMVAQGAPEAVETQAPATLAEALAPKVEIPEAPKPEAKSPAIVKSLEEAMKLLESEESQESEEQDTTPGQFNSLAEAIMAKRKQANKSLEQQEPKEDLSGFEGEEPELDENDTVSKIRARLNKKRFFEGL